MFSTAADQPLGLQVAAAHAERARIERRGVGELAIDLELGVRQALGVAAVLEAAGDDGADLAHQRQVDRQRLVEALEHRDALAALQDPAEEVGRERPEHHEIDDADLDAARLAQIVGDRLGGGDDAALAEDQVVGVLGAVAHDAGVGPPGEGAELLERPVGEPLHMVEEEGALRGDALHVRVLVLHQARHHRVVDVPEQRNAPPGVAVEDALRRRRRLDDVLGRAPGTRRSARAREP